MSKPRTNSSLLKKLKPFILSVSTCNIESKNLFEFCVKASISKAFEFANEAHTKRKNRIAFFLVPSLRSICEDIIILGYIANIPEPERTKLITLFQIHELRNRVKTQAVFFNNTRPDQPVLNLNDTSLKDIEDQMREIWKKNGWPNLKKAYMPNVRDIAEKHHLNLLPIVYDYLYRLTSGMVHFNPQVLFRSGWGDPRNKMIFSPKNFDNYYLSFAQTYGLLLTCFYFELFHDLLQPTDKVIKIVSEIRDNLIMQPRWPEMITYEEMNREPPSGGEIFRLLYRGVSAQQYKSGFLTPKNLTD